MKIIDRGAWGARYGRGDLDPGAESRVVIHHSYRPALSPTDPENLERAAVRSIENYHVNNNKWAGIGYGFLVAPSGRVYEGRGWKHRGSHAGPVNGTSIGICLLIDGSTTEPSHSMIAAVRALILLGLELGELTADYTVSGHRDHMERTCPGNLVYARLQEFRHDAALEEVPIAPGIRRPPGAGLILTKIARPTPDHVSGILRVRRVAPAEASIGLEIAEVLLRGVVAGVEAGAREAVKSSADAIADWIKEFYSGGNNPQSQ